MTIDRNLLREQARACRSDPYGIVMSGEELLAILDALEQAEAERDSSYHDRSDWERHCGRAEMRAEQAEASIQAVRELHRANEYRPGDHYANYGPPKLRFPGRHVPEPLPEVVTVCEECQSQVDEHLLGESGGFGGWEIAEYPCSTIRVLDGDV